MDRRLFVESAGIVLANLLLPAFAKSAELDRPIGHRQSFTPGEPWLDSAGKPIHVHGGSILELGGDFYWYGENKEFTTGETDVWTWGVRCYRSRDLYNWDDLGLIIPPNLTYKSALLSPSRLIDRPHILHDVKAGKFICWMKIMEKDRQTRAVLIANTMLGPYRLVRRRAYSRRQVLCVSTPRDRVTCGFRFGSITIVPLSTGAPSGRSRSFRLEVQ